MIASACVCEAKSEVFAVALRLRSHGAQLFVAANGNVPNHTSQFLKQIFGIMCKISEYTKDRVKLGPDEASTERDNRVEISKLEDSLYALAYTYGHKKFVARLAKHEKTIRKYLKNRDHISGLTRVVLPPVEDVDHHSRRRGSSKHDEPVTMATLYTTFDRVVSTLGSLSTWIHKFDAQDWADTADDMRIFLGAMELLRYDVLKLLKGDYAETMAGYASGGLLP